MPLERVPGPAKPATGEVPADVMTTVMSALEQLTGAERSNFAVRTAREMVWPNGALGCPQPGMVYTQATIRGYWIVLEHEGRRYDYRTGKARYLMLCLEPGLPIPSRTPAPTR